MSYRKNKLTFCTFTKYYTFYQERRQEETVSSRELDMEEMVTDGINCVLKMMNKVQGWDMQC